MFKFFFIKKHKKSVIDYIKTVFDGPAKGIDSGVRYALSWEPEEKTEQPDNTRYSDRVSDDSEIRYSLKNDSQTLESKADSGTPILYGDRDPVPEEKTIKYSHRASSKSTYSSGEIKYSDRGGPSDGFDPAVVASLMSSYLQERTPAKPLSSTTNLTFVQKLEQHIRNKHLVEADVYKAALMDRRLFSKIICNNHYKPSKDTALALIFALKLDLDEAKDLLERAGYTLSHSILRDIIIEYFIKERVYNLNNINAFLYNMDEKIIGRSV